MLYHVSLDLIEKFELRVPESCFDCEDKTIKRICFAKSIEGAITAMPYNINILSGLLNLKKEFDIEPILYVYSIDEKDLSPRDIKDSSELMFECLVSDANITSEVWVLTENIKPKLTAIKVIDFNFDIKRLGNSAMYIVTKLKYEEITQDEINKNQKAWSEISSAVEKEINRCITPVLKRAYVASLSSFMSKNN